VTCSICRRNLASVGVLCEDCCDELATADAISPEQISTHGTDATHAAFVDVWGRLHPLDPVTTVGRRCQTFTLLDPSVSRQHATIAQAAERWVMSDLDSANGTFVDDVRITEPTRLRDGAKIRFGQLAFFFIEDSSHIPATRPRRSISQTIRAPSEPGASSATLEIPAQSRRRVAFKLHEATGGGGFIEIDGKQLQLTIPQLELVALLVRKMLADAGTDDDIRGFVQTADLRTLSLDAVEPDFDNVRQLIRRVRRAMIKADIGDIIESRQGLGYRLRVIPELA
jgi:hypothetical protein